ncbi:MAG: hypothetical protein ACREAD_03775 [Nitrosopumilaceae archaeon]
MQKYFLLALFAGLFLIPLGLHSAFAETWYPGQGLKVGDYYRYSVCFTDWHNCTPIEIDFWVQNKTSDGSGYNLQMLAIDGSNVQKGTVTIGTVTPDPVSFNPNVADYANVYKQTIIWLDSFSTSVDPKALDSPSWGRTGSVGGQSVASVGQEQVTVQGGTYKAWIIGWHKGVDNKIWVVPNLPFPVKGIVYTDVTQGTPPPQYVFELLETGNSRTQPQFLNRVSSQIAGAGICPTDDTSAVHQSVNTDTSSMIVEYRYTPAVPHQGCPVQWSLYFEQNYDPNTKIANIQYDIYTVDDQGKKIGSVAEDLGKSTLFAPVGDDFRTIVINQPPPTTHYIIYVAGTGPENTVPNPILYGLVKVDVNTAPPLAVPEFPISAIMVMAIVVSMVILFTRFKTNFSNLKF